MVLVDTNCKQTKTKTTSTTKTTNLDKIDFEAKFCNFWGLFCVRSFRIMSFFTNRIEKSQSEWILALKSLLSSTGAGNNWLQASIKKVIHMVILRILSHVLKVKMLGSEWIWTGASLQYPYHYTNTLCYEIRIQNQDMNFKYQSAHLQYCHPWSSSCVVLVVVLVLVCFNRTKT